MISFLIITVFGVSLSVITQIVWLTHTTIYHQSTLKWIECTQGKISLRSVWKYEIGDECISQLIQDGYYFPNVMYFIAFPVFILFSHVALMILVWRKSQYKQWKIIFTILSTRFIAQITSKNTNVNISAEHAQVKKSKDEEDVELQRKREERKKNKLKKTQEISNVTENDIKEIENINQQQMELYENLISEHEVGGDNDVELLESKLHEPSPSEQVEMLIKLDREKNEHKLEHIAGVSFDYDNFLPKSVSSKAMDSVPDVRSKTLPALPKRTSTQQHFISFLEEALNDAEQKPTNTSDIVNAEKTQTNKAANIILRNKTDLITKKVNDNHKLRLKLAKVSTYTVNTGMDRSNLQQRHNVEIQEVKERQQHMFFDEFGQRKNPKNHNGKLRNVRKPLKSEFTLSSGTSIYTPSVLLAPTTGPMSMQLSHIDEDDENSDHNKRLTSMTWQSRNNSNIFHFTLIDNDFQNMLHSTFTSGSNKSINEIQTDHYKIDKSVAGIGCDGTIVLRDALRCKNAYGYVSPVQTLHEKLLMNVPQEERINLIITIHPDFSCEVAEIPEFYKPQLAKLTFGFVEGMYSLQFIYES